MQNDIVRQPPQDAQAAAQAEDTPVGQKTPNTPPVSEPEVMKTPVDDASKLSNQKAPHQSSRPIGIIIVAVIICASLVAGVLYAGLTQTKSSKNTSTTSTQSLSAPTNTVNNNDLDDAISDSTALSEQPQDATGDLSEQALGL